MSTDEQWLTYRQAAELLHSSPEAVRQRARRMPWRTQRGNDGKALILVPQGEAERPAVQPPVQPPGQEVESEALSTLVNTLRDELERVQAIAADERRLHLDERTRLTSELQAEHARHRVQLEAQEARHAADVGWHRKEMERLQHRLDELAARSWWQRLWRRGSVE